MAFLRYRATQGIFPSFSRPVFMILLLSVINSAAGQARDQTDPRTEQYARLSPAMAVVVIIFIAALFFMGFFSIYIRHCTGRPGTDGASTRGAPTRRFAHAAARGLDASIIETFPTFVYSDVKTLKIGKGALECAVCLNEFEDEETLRLLPKCDHVFHPHCIDAWLEGHVTCPVCRSDLTESDSVQPTDPTQPEIDLEAQIETEPGEAENQPQTGRPRVLDISGSLNRFRGSQSRRTNVKFQRWHSTGHSLIQPGENTERFTLRLPAEIRKQVMANRELNRANSLVVLPRESSTRRGKQFNNRPRVRSDRWLFAKTPSFLWRNPSVRSPKAEEGSSLQPEGTIRSTGESVRPDWRKFLKSPSFMWRNPSVQSPKPATNNDDVKEGSSVQPTGTPEKTSDYTRLLV